MPLYIKNEKAEMLAREVAGRYGVSMTEAVINALEEKLARQQYNPDTDMSDSARLAGKLMETGMHCASLPDLDTRTADEIIGYSPEGVPL